MTGPGRGPRRGWGGGQGWPCRWWYPGSGGRLQQQLTGAGRARFERGKGTVAGGAASGSRQSQTSAAIMRIVALTFFLLLAAVRRKVAVPHTVHTVLAVRTLRLLHLGASGAD